MAYYRRTNFRIKNEFYDVLEVYLFNIVVSNSGLDSSQSATIKKLITLKSRIYKIRTFTRHAIHALRKSVFYIFSISACQQFDSWSCDVSYQIYFSLHSSSKKTYSCTMLSSEINFSTYLVYSLMACSNCIFYYNIFCFNRALQFDVFNQLQNNLHCSA